MIDPPGIEWRKTRLQFLSPSNTFTRVPFQCSIQGDEVFPIWWNKSFVKIVENSYRSHWEWPIKVSIFYMICVSRIDFRLVQLKSIKVLYSLNSTRPLDVVHFSIDPINAVIYLCLLGNIYNLVHIGHSIYLLVFWQMTQRWGRAHQIHAAACENNLQPCVWLVVT